MSIDDFRWTRGAQIPGGLSPLNIGGGNLNFTVFSPFIDRTIDSQPPQDQPLPPVILALRTVSHLWPAESYIIHHRITALLNQTR